MNAVDRKKVILDKRKHKGVVRRIREAITAAVQGVPVMNAEGAVQPVAPLERRAVEHRIDHRLADPEQERVLKPGHRVVAGMGSGDSSDINTYANGYDGTKHNKYNMRDHTKLLVGGAISKAEREESVRQTETNMAPVKGVTEVMDKHYETDPKTGRTVLKPSPLGALKDLPVLPQDRTGLDNINKGTTKK